VKSVFINECSLLLCVAVVRTVGVLLMSVETSFVTTISEAVADDGPDIGSLETNVGKDFDSGNVLREEMIVPNEAGIIWDAAVFVSPECRLDGSAATSEVVPPRIVMEA